MKKFFICSLALTLLFGCAHTNELSKYEINGKKALFEEYIYPEARTIQVEVQDGKSSDNLLEAVISIASGILSIDKVSRIRDAVDTDNIMHEVSSGLIKVLENYLGIEAVNSAKDNPDLIIKTELEKCELNVGEKNVTINLKANAEIIERKSGKVIWDNWETYSVPVTGINDEGVTTNKSDAEMSVITAVQLASLSTKEINWAVGKASEEVGRLMGETFREDLADSRTK